METNDFVVVLLLLFSIIFLSFPLKSYANKFKDFPGLEYFSPKLKDFTGFSRNEGPPSFFYDYFILD